MIKFNKIFGIGLDRTGTSSLTAALEILGIKTMHKAPYMRGVLDTERKLKSKILSTLSEYQAFTDNPFPGIFKELDVEYPDSKFIVTYRDFDSWLKSKITLSIWDQKAFGTKKYDETKVDRPRYLRSFCAHYIEIRRYFKYRESDIIWMNICDGAGWQELCNFLQARIPSDDFPHKNKSDILK